MAQNCRTANQLIFSTKKKILKILILWRFIYSSVSFQIWWKITRVVAYGNKRPHVSATEPCLPSSGGTTPLKLQPTSDILAVWQLQIRSILANYFFFFSICSYFGYLFSYFNFHTVFHEKCLMNKCLGFVKKKRGGHIFFLNKSRSQSECCQGLHVTCEPPVAHPWYKARKNIWLVN